ncbi:MAG: pimeloyl-ACP methyl ester esterase BioH [Proteobacteria bacterium]|nr:pimeloyl-ACP methyl ester esterase BioH [Pseudomonadota bacterium]
MKIVETFGRGPVINMLHGWGMHAGIFKTWATDLSKDFTLNLIDLPGHGHNQNQTLTDKPSQLVEDCKELPTGIWLGWSMGGLIALNQALHRPEQVHALIMVCATPCFQANQNWRFGMPPKTVETFKVGLQQNVQATIERFLALEVMGVRHEKQHLKQLKNIVFQQPLPQKTSLINGLKLLQEVDLSLALKNLGMPSLWLSGRRDRIVHPDAMQQAAKLSCGQFHLCRGGHAPFLQHADDMSQIIRDFI